MITRYLFLCGRVHGDPGKRKGRDLHPRGQPPVRCPKPGGEEHGTAPPFSRIPRVSTAKVEAPRHTVPASPGMIHQAPIGYGNPHQRDLMERSFSLSRAVFRPHAMTIHRGIATPISKTLGDSRRLSTPASSSGIRRRPRIVPGTSRPCIRTPHKAEDSLCRSWRTCRSALRFFRVSNAIDCMPINPLPGESVQEISLLGRDMTGPSPVYPLSFLQRPSLSINGLL